MDHTKNPDEQLKIAAQLLVAAVRSKGLPMAVEQGYYIDSCWKLAGLLLEKHEQAVDQPV